MPTLRVWSHPVYEYIPFIGNRRVGKFHLPTRRNHLPVGGMTGALFSCLRALAAPLAASLLMAVATAAYALDDAAGQDVYLDAMRLIASGQKQEASAVLARIIRDEPEHAGAWLDLAILRCEMGYAEEAERLFAELVARFQPPPGILEVIAQRRKQGCDGWQPASRMSFMAGRGADSNVNQGASTSYFTLGVGNSRIELQLLPEYLPKSDRFAVLSAEYARDLTAAGTMGFVQFQARRNDALTQYDTALIAAGAEHPWHVGNWSIRGAGTLAALSLGGRLYQQQQQLQARISPPLPLPENLQFSILAGMARVVYPTLENFDANMREMRGLLNYRAQQTQAQASIGYSSDHASAARPGGDRQGWLAGMQAQTRIADRLFGELGWSRQTWRSESFYLPGLIDLRRNQTTDILRAGLIIPVAARQAVRIELQDVRNKENISIFRYNNRQLLMNWQWRDF